jgi:bifunctional UDP-N-acetylglucosamine pyrophosphorylase/glucosamine-1-phosphate N-acetyltransferase
MNVDVVIMAAGKGTRMRSQKPKVLHKLAERPLLQHVLDTVAQLPQTGLQLHRVLVITGHGAAEVEGGVHALPVQGHPLDMQFVRQEPQLGTGHAVQQAVPWLGESGVTLVLNGDTPLIKAHTAAALIKASGGEGLALLTIDLPNPTGYGRIVRQDAADIQAIVEEKDATPEQRHLTEVYTGVMAAPTAWMKKALMRLTPNNAQGEYYLTDLVALAVADGLSVVSAQPDSDTEVLGVNSPAQLADLERRYQRQQAEHFMQQGVRLRDPERFDVRGTLVCATDVDIDVGCIFAGEVHLGEGVQIGAHCVIANARIEAGAVIHPFTHIEGEHLGVQVGAGALVGPFARLRPGAQLGAEVHIGNFVEVKNSTLAQGAKANHLAYLGDATVGERVNFGAGSITANYDGANKHRTVIEAEAHIGSNCVLVAPVTIGAGATIGGGSTIAKDAPAGQLTVVRAKQLSLPGWKRPVKLTKGS